MFSAGAFGFSHNRFLYFPTVLGKPSKSHPRGFACDGKALFIAGLGAI